MSALPEVTEIGRIEIRPGDRFIVKISDRFPDITDQQAVTLKDRVAAALGINSSRVLILGPGVDVEVASGVPG